MDLATVKAQKARQKANDISAEKENLLAEVEDLDEGGSPEALLLSYVSMDNDADRVAREQVIMTIYFPLFVTRCVELSSQKCSTITFGSCNLL